MDEKRWFFVYVRCVSTERFDVQASSEEEARALYEAGKAELTMDEMDSREVDHIEEG